MNKEFLAFSVPISLISLCTLLLLLNKLSSGSFTVTFIASLVIGAVIYFSDQIEKVSLIKGELTLRKIQAAERNVKEIAEKLVGLLAYHSSYTSGSAKQRRVLNEKMRSLMSTLGTAQKKVDELMKIPEFMERFMGEKDENKLEETRKELHKDSFFG